MGRFHTPGHSVKQSVANLPQRRRSLSSPLIEVVRIASAQADDRLPVAKLARDVYKRQVQFHPNNDGESNIQSAIISAAANVGHDRGVRIVASRSSWTHRMLPLIFTCAIVVLACSYLYAGKGSLRLHAVLVSLVAITLGTNIGVIFLMTRPFSSEWAIKPEGFELHVKAMRDYKNSPPHP